MAYLNDSLWKNSYLLEFKINDQLQDAFTFSVPVQSEDFTFPQRIGETKTFGGVVFEDYGNDTVNINLSGTTINQSVKLIYKSEKGTATMTGEEEVFYLQSLIAKYGMTSKLKGKKVMLYQLTDGSKDDSTVHKYWQVLITSFQIKRSKDKPFCYDYTLQMKAYPESNEVSLSQKNSVIRRWLMGDGEKMHNYFIDGLKASVEKLNGIKNTIMNGIKEYQKIIGDLQDFTDEFESAINSYVGFVTGIMDGVTTAVTETKEFFSETRATVLKLSPHAIFTNLNTSATKLVTSCNELKTWFTDFSDTSDWEQIEQNCAASWGDLKDAKSELFTMIEDTKEQAEELEVAVKKNTGTISLCVIPGSGDTNDSVQLTYGYKVQTVTSSDSWEQIAFKYYGDTSYAQMLALFNGMFGKSLTTGSQIYIPILNQAENNTEGNEVYNPPFTMDNCGKDIVIVGGDISTDAGDLAIAANTANIDNAVLNRLSTALNSRVRNVVYGIRSGVGEDQAASSYVTASIEQTILEDPRIESVDEINYNGNGDNIALSVSYTTVNGEKVTLKEVI